MRAVILAAGRGTRIQSVTNGTPKCLIEIDGRTILENQIEGLWSAGVSKIAVVIGHNGHLIVNRAKQLYKDCFHSLTFIENPEYAVTNNIYSLWMARHWARSSDFLCLNADVLCHPNILLPERHWSLASMIVDPAWRDETMKVIIRKGQIVKMSKGISRADYSATYIGITAFSRHIAPVLFDEIEKMIAEGRVNEFFNAAVQRLIDRGLRVGFESTRGLPWAEVDDETDLEFARTAVSPRLPPPCGVVGPGGRVKAVA
jgi:choline kinase